MIARARFTERVESLAVVYACVVGVGMPSSLLGMLGLAPDSTVQQLTGIPAAATNFGIQMGSFLIAAVVLALLVGGIFAYRTSRFRRYVGVLWDLGTFWPRVAHPFAPPCYAERAVPELSRRIGYLAEQGHGVLLTGHSHGSVLLAATILQLPPEVCGRLALLTYGSPLRRLYARLFPAYVSDEVLRDVGDRVNWRWINLWRDTDRSGAGSSRRTGRSVRRRCPVRRHGGPAAARPGRRPPAARRQRPASDPRALARRIRSALRGRGGRAGGPAA